MRKHLFSLIITIAIIVFSTFKGYSPHIVGGEIHYKCLGSNWYEITLKVYRDCAAPPPAALYDNPAWVFVFDSAGDSLKRIDIPFPGSDTIDPYLSDSCIVIPPNLCVEEAIYTINDSLPPIPGGYHLVYQRCCRNVSIVNIFNPGTVGATYETIIPDTSLVSCNNSPYFNNFPPIAICANEPMLFDHSATDLDGDSLVYELGTPFLGATSTSPMPNPASSPPYDTVPFINPPYWHEYPINASPPLAVDPQTGLLTGTPTLLGQFVVGISVKEYRNQVLITEHKRDFQFNVSDCQKFSIQLPNDTALCTGDTLTITNPGFDPTYDYQWSPSTGIDDSTIAEPTITLINDADTSVTIYYIHTIIAHAGCDTIDTVAVTVYPLLITTVSPTQVINKGKNTTITASGGVQYNWQSNPPSVNIDNPNIAAPTVWPDITTVYEVLITDSNGCQKMDTTEVVVISLDMPTAFTPNGDGINDIYFARGDGWEELEFKIFNRWGELLFESHATDLSEGWNGTYKDKKQPISTYIYYIKATDLLGEITIEKGNLTLIR